MTEKDAIEILKDMNDGYAFQDCRVCVSDNKFNEKKGICESKTCEYLNAIETVLKALEQKDTTISLYKKLYEDLQKDFDDFKRDKDINYLDRIHHKKLVEKSIGQTIDKPEECWFDEFEVKIIKNDKLYGVATREDFVNLKQISDEDPENCITVIAESALSGAIYRYNNYNNKEWQLVGTMLGYA